MAASRSGGQDFLSLIQLALCVWSVWSVLSFLCSQSAAVGEPSGKPGKVHSTAAAAQYVTIITPKQHRLGLCLVIFKLFYFYQTLLVVVVRLPFFLQGKASLPLKRRQLFCTRCALSFIHSLDQWGVPGPLPITAAAVVAAGVWWDDDGG